MEEPDIVKFCDNFFRKVFYGIGPYIADYPEQVLVACIVQGFCPLYVCQKYLKIITDFFLKLHGPF